MSTPRRETPPQANEIPTQHAPEPTQHRPTHTARQPAPPEPTRHTLTDTLTPSFLRSFPELGVKVSLILLVNLPFPRARSVNLTSSRAWLGFEAPVRPLPPAVRCPAAGTHTPSVTVRPRTFFDFTASASAHPSTSMGVLWLTVAPFCPMNEVGIASFCRQRLPLAASAE